MNLKELVYKQVLRLEDIKKIRTESPYLFRASEAGDCKRVLWQRKLNYKPEYSYKDDDDRARVMMLLNDGAGVHQSQLTKYLYQTPELDITNIEEDRSMVVSREEELLFTVTGHPDGIIYDKVESKSIVLEVKGISTNYCRKLEDNNLDMLKAIWPTGYKAILQTRIYMDRDMFNTEEGIIILKDKNNSALYEFHIERDDSITEKIINKFVSVYKACLEKKMPECNYVKGDKRCMYCPYPKDCGS